MSGMMVCICNPKAGRQSGGCLRLICQTSPRMYGEDWRDRFVSRNWPVSLWRLAMQSKNQRHPREVRGRALATMSSTPRQKLSSTLCFSLSQGKLSWVLPDYPNYSLTRNKMMLPMVKGEILAIERSEWVFYSVSRLSPPLERTQRCARLHRKTLQRILERLPV